MLEFVGTERNFRKMNARAINTFDFPYDFGSVMHYGSKFFSKNGKPTIRVKKVGVGLSFIFTCSVEKLKTNKPAILLSCVIVQVRVAIKITVVGD